MKSTSPHTTIFVSFNRRWQQIVKARHINTNVYTFVYTAKHTYTCRDSVCFFQWWVCVSLCACVFNSVRYQWKPEYKDKMNILKPPIYADRLHLTVICISLTFSFSISHTYAFDIHRIIISSSHQYLTLFQFLIKNFIGANDSSSATYAYIYDSRMVSLTPRVNIFHKGNKQYDNVIDAKHSIAFLLHIQTNTLGQRYVKRNDMHMCACNGCIGLNVCVFWWVCVTS